MSTNDFAAFASASYNANSLTQIKDHADLSLKYFPKDKAEDKAVFQALSDSIAAILKMQKR